MKTLIITILFTIPIFRNYINCLRAGILFVNPLNFIKANLGFGKHYYPFHSSAKVQHPNQIVVGRNCSIFREGAYVQAEGGIYVGDNVRIAPYTTLMSTNHDIFDHNKKHPKPIIIHDNCWIGTHAIVLAGVELGPRTIVGAGAVVTKSFPEGYCLIGGNPARVIKCFDKQLFTPPLLPLEKRYYGLLTEKRFDKLKKRFLSIDEQIFESQKWEVDKTN